MRGREGGSDWLEPTTGPHIMELWTGKYARLCNKELISHGKSNAPLQSVRIVTCYSLFREGATNAAGKELHESSGQPMKAGGHIFS